MIHPVVNTIGVPEILIQLVCDQNKEEANSFNGRQNGKWPPKGEVKKKVTFELHLLHSPSVTTEMWL